MGRYLRTTPKATLAFGLERPPPASISAFDPKQHRQFLLNWTSVQLATFLSIDENRKCERPECRRPRTCSGRVNGADGVALQNCLEARNENNHTHYFCPCACTRTNVGQRGAYAP